MNGLGIGAQHTERGGGPGVVLHLHEKSPPAILDQFRPSRALGCLDAHLRVDGHEYQAMRIENPLDLFGGLVGIGLSHGGLEGLLFSGRQRRSERIQRFSQALELSG